MKVSLVDLRAQYADIQQEVDAAISSVILESAFIGGPYVKRFESEFAAFCGVQHAVGVSNGTEAVRLALLACGVRAGDEVITVPNTFIATAEAISALGAIPRFVDVSPESLSMDPALLERAITEKTRAILPVHLYGCPAEMTPILNCARQHGLRVVGDAAQAHGAMYRGQNVASLGDVTCFSFYPGKNLGAYGDAGAIVTNDESIAMKVSLLRDHGRRHKYEHEVPGFNARLDGMQAAILSVKLRHLDAWTQCRQRIAARYDEMFKGCDGLRPLQYPEHVSPVYHLYVLRVDDREALAARLEQRGISTGIHYPIPLHRQSAYADLGLGEGSFPVAEDSAKTVLSIPIYPELTDEQVNHVVEQIRGVAVAG